MLSRSSLIFRSLQNSVIMAAGDIFTQTFSEKNDMENIDLKRTTKFAAIGFFFAGPLTAHWNGIMGKIIAEKQPLLNKSIKKTLNTQTFLAAPLNFGIITFTAVLNGIIPTRKYFEHELKGNFLTVMELNYIVWLPAQFTANLIPYSTVKSIAINTVSFLWFAYLSGILMKSEKSNLCK